MVPKNAVTRAGPSSIGCLRWSIPKPWRPRATPLATPLRTDWPALFPTPAKNTTPASVRAPVAGPPTPPTRAAGLSWGSSSRELGSLGSGGLAVVTQSAEPASSRPSPRRLAASGKADCARGGRGWGSMTGLRAVAVDDRLLRLRLPSGVVGVGRVICSARRTAICAARLPLRDGRTPLPSRPATAGGSSLSRISQLFHSGL